MLYFGNIVIISHTRFVTTPTAFPDNNRKILLALFLTILLWIDPFLAPLPIASSRNTICVHIFYFCGTHTYIRARVQIKPRLWAISPELGFIRNWSKYWAESLVKSTCYHRCRGEHTILWKFLRISILGKMILSKLSNDQILKH